MSKKTNTRPALTALEDSIEAYRSINGRISELKASIEADTAEQKAIASDQTGDVAKLTKKSLTLKNRIDEANAEIEIISTRLNSTAEAIEPFIDPAISEVRRLEHTAETQKQEAAEAILKDPELLEWLSKLRAALHMVGDSHHWMNELELSDNFAGNHLDDYQKHGLQLEPVQGDWTIELARDITRKNRAKQDAAKRAKQRNSNNLSSFEQFIR